MSDEASPYQLYADPFTESDRSELVDFDCGQEAWSRAATEWILGSDVWESIKKRQTQVWLYRLESGVIVGFGSLGTTRRKWPPPDGGYANLLIIPMLGIDCHFHGQPPDKTMRYSKQILGHLCYEATQLLQTRAGSGKATLPLLTLYVHKDNVRAIRLYEQFRFTAEAKSVRPDGLVLMAQRL